MIKSINKHKLEKKDKDLKNSLVIAHRNSKDVILKVDTNAAAEFNEETQEFTLKWHMRPGDVIVIGDKDGFSEKFNAKKVR